MTHLTGNRNARVAVLALDLERTLIDNAMNGQARPGLYEFLAFCHDRFPRIAIFTTVDEDDARDVLATLDQAGYLPNGLLERLEFIAWSGEFKDLAFISDATPDEVLLVDDDSGWIQPDQQERWIPIAPWDGGRDNELQRVRAVLEQVLTCSRGEVDE